MAPSAVEDIIKEGITEAIVTTVSRDGVPNAAPMGIVRQGSRFFIRMYSETTTFKNATETGYLVVNFIADSRVYVISAFGELAPQYFQFEDDMVPPRLREAAGWAYFKCRTDEVVELSPVSARVARCTLPVFNRGFAAVVEATIVGTRLHLYNKDEKIEKKIHDYESIVRKCGSPTDIEAIRKLKEILKII